MTFTERKSDPRYMHELVDSKNGKISREIFVSEEIFEQELETIFTRCWLFIGHESQIRNPGDFFVSRMGNDSVIMTKDNEGKVNVLLNSCRHRGMKVSRYDEGNTMEFFCPFHGWTYSIDGSLVTYPGELFGVPHFETAYGGKLNKKDWGLVACPQVKNYKGLIFATWDPEAPSFEEYLGDFHYWIDNLSDALDGTPGGAEVFHGVQKWRVRSNWKFVAENFLGDVYHGTSTHASVEAVGIGPGGRRRSRHGGERPAGRKAETSFVNLGHGSVGSVASQAPYPSADFAEPELREYFKNAWEKKVERYSAAGKPIGATNASTMFPNMSLASQAFPHTILVAQPISATETEMWRWYIIDKEAPEIVRQWCRHYAMRYSGPAGLTEQDDMENWDYATAASAGTIARRYDYNYEMGINMSREVPEIEGAVESSDAQTEENARNYYRRWARIMDGENWQSLMDLPG